MPSRLEAAKGFPQFLHFQAAQVGFLYLSVASDNDRKGQAAALVSQLARQLGAIDAADIKGVADAVGFCEISDVRSRINANAENLDFFGEISCCRADNSGISSTQGAHQVAQKFTTST